MKVWMGTRKESVTAVRQLEGWMPLIALRAQYHEPQSGTGTSESENDGHCEPTGTTAYSISSRIDL